MQSYTINTDTSQLSSLLANDLAYLKSHANPNLSWGNCTGNLSPKFNQYDELSTLPVFGELLSAGYEINKVVLSTIKPNCTKIIQNSDYINVDEIINTSIIIPLDVDSIATYVWYDSNYITQHNIRSLPLLRKEHGNKVVEGSCVIGNGCLLLVKHQNYWAAISNKQDRDFNFLQISLSNNPGYDELKIILERTQVATRSLDQDHNVS